MQRKRERGARAERDQYRKASPEAQVSDSRRTVERQIDREHLSEVQYRHDRAQKDRIACRLRESIERESQLHERKKPNHVARPVAGAIGVEV